MTVKLDYVWLDGHTQKNLRSKIRFEEIKLNSKGTLNLKDIPRWSFDGSSTQQASSDNSDLILKPVKVVKNPLSNKNEQYDSFIVLCEVLDTDGKPHNTNTRHALGKLKKNDIIFSAEQEYTILDARTVRPLGWPKSPEGETIFPLPQARYYCGTGDFVKGRNFIDKYTNMLVDAGLNVRGVNAEVMLSQWEYQLGNISAVDLADELWISRYIIERLSEYFGMIISWEPKPIPGDWNGSGCHFNFSTKKMRDGGYDEKYASVILDKLEQDHFTHIRYCGLGNENRLTGEHETCHMSEFKHGVGDRSASVRIPAACVKGDNFYMEDRRPAANCDPYEVLLSLSKSIVSGHEELNSLKGQEVEVVA